MKIQFILFLATLSVCSTKPTDKVVETKVTDASSIEANTQEQDTAIFQTDTIQINDIRYIQISNENRFNCLMTLKGDTVVKSEDFYFEASFFDLDEDGFEDIRVFAISNTPNQCDNYLFDTATHKFKLIENCYLDIQKIEGTTFFYSYQASGCADHNWESHLCKIENFNLVNYGYIYGQSCDFLNPEADPPVIEVFKIAGSKMELVEKLPYQKLIRQPSDKWDFIKKYWSKNYTLFERQ